MYVCICKSVTDHQITNEVLQGACSMRDLCERLGVATQCGKCGQHARHVLQESLACIAPTDDPLFDGASC